MQPNLPVNLLVKGRPCLVVGAGAVAARKVKALLAAGATVQVVAPEVCRELAGAVAAGEIEYAARRFAPADVAGKRLVFAATNERAVNRAVLDAARKAGALCGCVDSNWADGDFVTPAVLQQEGLTVAVSTGGQSCRRARTIKNLLARCLDQTGPAEWLVVGTSHAQLTLAEREGFQLAGDRLKEAGDMLSRTMGMHEFMLLVTCNRVEWVGVASKVAGLDRLAERILGLDRLRPEQRYCLRGRAAYDHLALVTAGMLSQSPGEHHVAAQVKAALELARRQGWAGALLQAWVASALHVSKHIKNEATPLLRTVEIEDVAVAYAETEFGRDWRAHTILVIGSGSVGQGLVEQALARHGRIVWCYHRNRPKTEAARDRRVQLVPFARLPESLGSSHIVFCAVNASGAVLQAEHAPYLDGERRVLLVDLGVPRNVDPALGALLRKAELVNLDRLKRWAAEKHGNLDRIMTLCRRILEQHDEEYHALVQGL